MDLVTGKSNNDLSITKYESIDYLKEGIQLNDYDWGGRIEGFWFSLVSLLSNYSVKTMKR